MPLHTETAPDGTPERLRNSVRLAGLNTSGDNTEQANYQVTLTAIPWDNDRWGIKAVCPEGAARLPGIFPTRTEALGHAVLLAERCGGTVCP